jgi:inner membrane transporter RhtA
MTSTSTGRMASLFPIALLLLSMFCFMAGASLAQSLFAAVSPLAVVGLRTGFGTLLLAAVMQPWRVRVPREAWPPLVVYGVVLGLMNMLYYQALGRIPLGIATAIEFTGPLSVSIAYSHRRLDLCWAALAAGGLVLLTPFTHQGTGLDPVGVLYALAAGACWALYIIFGRKAGASLGTRTVALGSLISAIFVVPVGIAAAGPALLSPHVLGLGLAVAALSTALPYPLEMAALTRLPTRTFGILMCGEPAIGALLGYAFLGQHLAPTQAAAIAMIILASIGSVATRRS